MYGRTKVTCQNHISIWHGVHMALATIIKFFCFSYMELRGDKYDTKAESLWHLLKYNSMCANAPNPISHNSSLMYIWLQLTRGKTICQYRLLFFALPEIMLFSLYHFLHWMNIQSCLMWPSNTYTCLT